MTRTRGEPVRTACDEIFPLRRVPISVNRVRRRSKMATRRSTTSSNAYAVQFGLRLVALGWELQVVERCREAGALADAPRLRVAILIGSAARGTAE